MINKVLVLAAHPDDEVLGCGATISKHVASGDRVQALILGEGVRARKGTFAHSADDEVNKLLKDCFKASQVLGMPKPIVEKFPDNKFDSVPLLEITHEIEDVIEKFAPNIIYTHSKADVNIDHRKTLEALEPVIRPYANKNISCVYSFEIPSSTESNFVRKNFSPNYFVEIDQELLGKKIEALKCYSNEIREFPHPRSVEYSEKMASIRGSQAGVKLAEAFEVVFCLERGNNN